MPVPIHALSLAALAAFAGPAADGFRVARWIAPPTALTTAPLFRKEFVAPAGVRRAVLRIVGLGDYHATVNGSAVAPTGINQPWSQYERTVYYREFDVTARLRRGANCVGVGLGASFWHNPNPPGGRYNKDGPQRTAAEPYLVRAEVEMRLVTGAVRTIGTDELWLAGPSPIAFTHVYAGEDFDYEFHQPGWDVVGAAAGAWRPARLAQAPSAALELYRGAGFAAFERHAPASVKEAAPGVFLYAFPQNMSAQLRWRIAGGKPGALVRFRCGEHRSPAGRLYGGYVVDCSVRTNGQSTGGQWRFYYLGMQFVEVTGAVPTGAPNPEGLPVVQGLELVHVRVALPEAGSFRCSSELYNRTYRLIDWAMRSNTSWVMTDCPHREKLGWLECAYLLAPSFMSRYGCSGWFGKIGRDITDAQRPDGRVLTVAPSYPAGRFPGAFDFTVEWGAAAVLMPWEAYRWYGDPGMLRRHIDSMMKFTDHVESMSSDGIAPGGLGDWYDYGHGHGPGPSRFTPTELSATACWALCAKTTAEAAQALGMRDAAARYRAMYERIRSSFQRRFRDPATGRLRHGGSPQCANAMALCAGLAPASDQGALVSEIVQDLERRGWQQTPGDIGHVYLIRALAQAGRSDILHRVYSRTGKGSYGGILASGLSSLPETWDAMMDGYQSLNHCMLGHVMEWLAGYVGGIRQAAGSVGWREAVIQPCPGSLTWAESRQDTPRGRIACAWRRTGDQVRAEITIPRGVRANLVAPDGRAIALKSGRQAVSYRTEK